MSSLANIKKACLSRTPDKAMSPSDSGRSPFDSEMSPSDSAGSPFEDYEYKKCLHAINQLLEQDVTMQQDEKETSQPATNRQVESWSRASKFLYFCNHAVKIIRYGCRGFIYPSLHQLYSEFEHF